MTFEASVVDDVIFARWSGVMGRSAWCVAQ